MEVDIGDEVKPKAETQLKQNMAISDGVTIGVSCDDEGYETAGKKVLPVKPNKTGNKESRKVRFMLFTQ